MRDMAGQSIPLEILDLRFLILDCVPRISNFPIQFSATILYSLFSTPSPFCYNDSKEGRYENCAAAFHRPAGGGGCGNDHLTPGPAVGARRAPGACARRARRRLGCAHPGRDHPAPGCPPPAGAQGARRALSRAGAVGFQRAGTANPGRTGSGAERGGCADRPQRGQHDQEPGADRRPVQPVAIAAHPAPGAVAPRPGLGAAAPPERDPPRLAMGAAAHRLAGRAPGDQLGSQPAGACGGDGHPAQPDHADPGRAGADRLLWVFGAPGRAGGRPAVDLQRRPSCSPRCASPGARTWSWRCTCWASCAGAYPRPPWWSPGWSRARTRSTRCTWKTCCACAASWGWTAGPSSWQSCFPDGLGEGDLPGFYRLADALLLPSREEAFGIPLLEAGLSGLPIFCSELEPLKALAGENATFFDPDGNPEEIAGRIAGRLQIDPLYRMRTRVRREYTWEALYKKQIAPLLEE